MIIYVWGVSRWWNTSWMDLPLQKRFYLPCTHCGEAHLKVQLDWEDGQVMMWKEAARAAGIAGRQLPAVRFIPSSKVIQVMVDWMNTAHVLEYEVSDIPITIMPLAVAAYGHPYQWVWEE